MALWLRFVHEGKEGFGTLEGDTIHAHAGAGSMFAGALPTGERMPLSAVSLLTPTLPTRFIGLWNNYHALAAKQGNAIPAEPLYFLKAGNSFLASGQTIRVRAHYDGKSSTKASWASLSAAKHALSQRSTRTDTSSATPA